jgi:hypothetical protein
MMKVEDLRPGTRFRIRATAYILCRGGHHDHDGRWLVPVIETWSGRRTCIDSELPIDAEKEEKVPHKKVVLLKKSAAALGKKGGSAKTDRKATAARENGKKGGRPKKKK